ncbi:MAG: aldo/keto reductase [Acidimicrobiales bacterium]|jgi:aryl-alcohol dehydrogenase-like predicted oxidoreductase
MERRRPRRTQEWDVEVDVTPKSEQPVGSSGTFMLGDLPVHRMGFGAMRVTGPGIWGPPDDHDEAIAVLRRAVELGVDFIDTADSYGPYVSEELICEALYPYPEGLVIGTKAGLTRIGPDPADWPPVGRPEYLRQECLMSLRRLRLDCIDLFQLHRIDVKVPAAEQFGILKELRDEGKVRHVGLSEVTVGQIEAAREVVPIVSVQNLYNLADRRSEPVLEHCEGQGIGFIPWFPLAEGTLSGRRGALAAVAEALGASAHQVALAWLLRRSPVMVPIPGTSKVSHLEENCAASTVVLSDDQFEALARGGA